jgi:hypothetical protein
MSVLSPDTKGPVTSGMALHAGNSCEYGSASDDGCIRASTATCGAAILSVMSSAIEAGDLLAEPSWLVQALSEVVCSCSCALPPARQGGGPTGDTAAQHGAVNEPLLLTHRFLQLFILAEHQQRQRDAAESSLLSQRMIEAVRCYAPYAEACGDMEMGSAFTTWILSRCQELGR